MADYPRNFQFTVEFSNLDFSEDKHFQSIEGLHAHLLPDEHNKSWNSQFDVLILKRAYRPNSKIVAWCMNAINNKIIKGENLTINLLNSRLEVINQWQVENAIPQSWRISAFNAEESDILIETITLKYNYFQVANGDGKIISPKKKPKFKRLKG